MRKKGRKPVSGRKCQECGEPGGLPLIVFRRNGRMQRGYWHLPCVRIVRAREDKRWGT